jgi:hypothetical protein
MVISDQFKVENDKANMGIKFDWGGNVTDAITSNSVSFSSPGKDSTQNISTNFGFKRLITFDFRITNNGSDRGYVIGGAARPSTTTLKAQWDFLMDEVIEATVDDLGAAINVKDSKYKVFLYIAGTPQNFEGMIENITINPSDGSPFLEGSLTLIVGGVNAFVG